jgi:hypothetical protein
VLTVPGITVPGISWSDATDGILVPSAAMPEFCQYDDPWVHEALYAVKCVAVLSIAAPGSL